jgi:Peptidase family M23
MSPWMADQVVCNFSNPAMFYRHNLSIRDIKWCIHRERRMSIWRGLVCALIMVGTAHAASTWPVQLEMRVPLEPTAFSSGGQTYLAYELVVTNFSGNPLTLRRIEVLDGDRSTATPILVLESSQLDDILQPVGDQKTAGESDVPHQLLSGSTSVVFVWIAVDRGTPIPKHLRHRVFTDESSVEGAVIGTHHTAMLVLAPPLRGATWLASDGPNNDRDNHHRRGFQIFDGHFMISRRFAIDWMKIDNGAIFSGDKKDKHAYPAYGQPVFAVANGTVVTARDGLPDNVPGHNEEFHPAVPITPDTLLGNTIVIDLGGEQFAFYAHLKPGSLRVKKGDQVKRGQLLANIGASGDAREPHLHFQVSTSSNPLAGDGVPYLLDQFRIQSTDHIWQVRTRELPLGGSLIDFAENQRHSPSK